MTTSSNSRLPIEAIVAKIMLHSHHITSAAQFRPTVAGFNSPPDTLRNWHAKLAPQPEPCGDDASLEELRAENQRLRRELRRAELEREILKKATAYFAKESL